MQELSLYGHVPAHREPLVRRLLSTIAAMPPDRIITHHLVFKPKRPRPQPGTGPAGQSELYTLQLVAEVREEKEENAELAPEEKVKKYLEGRKWVLKLADIPEGGRRPVTSRTVMSSEVSKGDIFAFMGNLGYKYGSLHWSALLD
jgi:mediator of RNA polymerase II transcription subunit 18